jgi:hypothetical protein
VRRTACEYQGQFIARPRAGIFFTGIESMFKVAQSSNYKYKVNVETNGANGQKEKSTFNVQFKRLKQTEITELAASIDSLSFEDLMDKVLVGWDGLVGSDNEVFEFNDANRALLFDIPEARFAVRDAFWESVRMGKQKN